MTDGKEMKGWQSTVDALTEEVEPTPVTDAPERTTVKCTVDQVMSRVAEVEYVRADLYDSLMKEEGANGSD